MVSVVYSLLAVFKKSFNLKLLLYFLVLILFGLIAGAILQQLTLGAAAQIALAPIMVQLSLAGEDAAALFALFNYFVQNIGFIAAVYLIALAVYFVLDTLVGAFLAGLQLNFASDFLSGKGISFDSALENTKQRFFTLFKANLLLSVLFSLLFLVFMIPVVLNALPVLSSIALYGLGALQSGVILGLLLNLLLFVGLYLLLFLLLSPFLWLVAPTALFESLGAIDSIKRAFSLAKGNYLRNLGYILFFALILLVILAGLSILSFTAALLITLIAGLFGAILGVLLLLLAVILFFALIIWFTAFTALAQVNLYAINTEASK